MENNEMEDYKMSEYDIISKYDNKLFVVCQVCYKNIQFDQICECQKIFDVER